MHWQIATVKSVTDESPRVRTLTLQLPQWMPHVPGQHYDLRLTAEDGYQTERSYSIASPPEQVGEIALTVERIDDGEVSPYLHEGLSPGDPLEVRGPIGGYFVWSDGLINQPLLLIAGGSGVVPLMAMLRHRRQIGSTNLTRLLFSVRTLEDLIYGDELRTLDQMDPAFELVLTFTRQAPPGWTGYHRRVDRAMLADVLGRFNSRPQCFICGPTLLVEAAANELVELGLSADRIRTERFGPTGN